MNEQQFDELLLDMRQEEPHPAELAAVQERVWHRVSAGDLCLQFRQQFPDWQQNNLPDAKRMLLEDHLSRCTDCRRALAEIEGRRNVVSMPAAPRRRFPVPRWAIAAGLAVVGLYAGRDYVDRWFAPSGPLATVQTVQGSFYAVSAATLASGAGLADGEVVRTAGGSHAFLRLADGSTVELNERTELSLRTAWSGQTIHLHRGDIVVQAAKQRRGSLRVVTRDSEAAVKGTIFTVSTGSAGSLVGVVEGSVAVTQPGTQRLLKPGERAASSQALAKVTVRDAVSWSSDAEKHYAVLAELAAIEKQLSSPAARTEARLGPVLPSDLVIYAAIPNLGPTLEQAVSLIEQRSNQVEALREWWTSSNSAQMKELIDRIRGLSPLLGDEIVFAVSKPAAGPGIGALFVEVKAGQNAALEQQIQSLFSGKPSGLPAYRFINNLLIVTDSQDDLTALLPRLGQGAGSPFVAEITARYARGVSWILAADVHGLHQSKPLDPKAAVFGVDHVRYLFLEQRGVQGVDENEASLTFDGPRTGIASWLSPPASSGSAEYVSSDAIVAFSAATRNPRQVVDELTAQLNVLDPSFGSKLNEIQSKTGISISTDLAASIGTDFTLAVETAAVPIPGWIAALEVYQPDTLNASLIRVADAYNAQLSPEEQNRKLIYATQTDNGRTWHSLSFGVATLALHWTYDRGYLLMSMDRGVASRALQTRDGGFQLIRSEQFRAQMPTLAGLHSSGFLWINLKDALAGLPVAGSSAGLQRFLAVREPSLITFNGETERIQVASRTRLASLMLDAFMHSGINKPQTNTAEKQVKTLKPLWRARG